MYVPNTKTKSLNKIGRYQLFLRQNGMAEIAIRNINSTGKYFTYLRGQH